MTSRRKVLAIWPAILFGCSRADRNFSALATSHDLAASLDELCNSADRSQKNLTAKVAALPISRLKAMLHLLLARLGEFTGSDDDYLVGHHLEVLRAISRLASVPPSAPEFALSTRSKLYAGRPKAEIVRLRSFLLVTLAYIGHAERGKGTIIDFLANGMGPLEIAAGARASRFLQHFPQLPSLLQRHIAGLQNDAMMSLDRYAQDFPRTEATCAQLEVLRTVSHFGARVASLRPALNQLVSRLQDQVVEMPIAVLPAAESALRDISL